MIATSGIRLGRARDCTLAYIAASGAITSAVSSRVWPGEAVLNVSIVNWIAGSYDGVRKLQVGEVVHQLNNISPHLQLHGSVGSAKVLSVSRKGTSLGVIFGSEHFRLPPLVAERLRSEGSLRATGSGTDILTGKIAAEATYVVWLTDCESESEAERQSPQGFLHLKERLFPEIVHRANDKTSTSDWSTWLKRWWKPQKARDSFFQTVPESRLIAMVRVQSRPIVFLLSRQFVPSDSFQLFAFDDDYSFGVIQSSLHWAWTKAKGGRLKSDIRYTSAVWKTFPWPQAPTLENVVAVAAAAKNLRATRDRLMTENGWSLRALYQAAEVEGPHPLKDAQAALDEAVEDAYGKPADQEATEFLLELNLALAEDEAAGETIQGPGLPRVILEPVDGESLDPKDERWFSTDCIEPPPLPTLDETDDA